MTPRHSLSPTSKPVWGLLLLAGMAWGFAATRVLASELPCALCYHPAGIAAGTVLGAGIAIGAGYALVRSSSGFVASLPWLVPLFLPLLDGFSAAIYRRRGPALVLGSLLVVLLGSLQDLVRRGPLSEYRLWRWSARHAPLLLALLIPFAVYLTGLSSYVGRADTFEFQVIGPQLGIAHPSGYPLYTLVCKLFSLLPLGTIAWRINLSSACFAALTSVFLYVSLESLSEKTGRVLSRRLALWAALFLAFSPTLWSRAIEAEVYTLNALLVALGLRLATLWASGKVRPRTAWAAFGALIGLALAAHITLGALGLLALAMLLGARERPDCRAWGAALLFGFLGLSLYAYIPLRWPAVTGGETMSLAAFIRYVTNADSGGALRPLAFYHDPGRWALVGRLLLAQFGWVGTALAVLGWASLLGVQPALAVGSLGAFGAWVWFNLSFYVAEPDYAAFLIPAHVVMAFWAGWGLQVIHRLLAATPSPTVRRRMWARGVLSALLAGVLLWAGLRQLWVTGPILDTPAEGRADEAWARYVLDLPLVPGAALLADSEKFPPLYYLQQIEGLRPDLEMVTLFSEQQYRRDLDERLARGQAVYLARYLPGMDAYGVSSLGPLVAVAPPSLQRAPETGSAVGFGEALALVGHRLMPDPRTSALDHLTLTWWVRAAVQDDLEVRLRLVALAEERTAYRREGERIVWEHTGGRPVRGHTVTSAWQPGWVVDDYHALQWPTWLPAGAYRLEVGLFPRFDGRGLPVGGGGSAWHPLEIVTLRSQSAELPEERLTILADPTLWLLAAQPPAAVSAGAAVELDLIWSCRAGDGPKSFVLHWALPNGQGEMAAQPLIARGYTEATLECEAPASRALARRYALTAPDVPGPYRLEISGDRGLRCNWLDGLRSRCPIGDIDVTPSPVGLANYDAQLLLLDAHFDATGVHAGGPLEVLLTWRAVQRPDRDYTVFLQVIGPDGRLYGQVDTWPVQGTRPTSGWQAAEELVDPYRFYVDTAGPSGEYTIIVGWYLLADMSRLPVIDASGRGTGDYYEIGSYSLP